jgi:hypothetical protein
MESYAAFLMSLPLDAFSGIRLSAFRFTCLPRSR